MTQDLLLAIDNGTQSVRVLVFDRQGNLLVKARAVYEPYFSDVPGWAEQHPQVFWDAVCQACREAMQTLGADAARLAGASLTTQRGTVINVDAAGQPLRPAISWLDQRRTEGLPPVGGLWGLGFRLAGMTETVAYLQAEAEANWIRVHQPELWAATHKYLLLSGYLTYKLTGRFADSSAGQVGYLPFDYQALHWARRWDWKWTAVPMDPRVLPELVPPAGRLGVITPEAAAATGLPAGLPLIAGASDKSCETIGVGALEPHIACLSFGTAATLSTIHRRYLEVIPLLPPYPAAVPQAYSVETAVYRGFWMVSWFKQEFGHHEQRLAEARGVAPETLFDELVRAVPPGSEGLLLQPYWSPGLKVPGPEARGAIIGFGGMHTRAHVYRAILEGLCFDLREGAERTMKRSGVRLRALRIAGGGSQSDAAMQIAADIFGLPAARPHVYEASGLGAAIDAAVGLGLYPDFPAAVAAMTRVGQVFEPDPRAHAVYDALFHQVYRRMYDRLKPLYTTLRRLAGRH